MLSVKRGLIYTPTTRSQKGPLAAPSLALATPAPTKLNACQPDGRKLVLSLCAAAVL